MLFGDMFDEFINIALITTTKTTLKSEVRHQKDFRLWSRSLVQKKEFTLYLDLTGEHRSTRERVYSIDPHDYDEDGVSNSFSYRLYKNRMYKHEQNRPVANVRS